MTKPDWDAKRWKTWESEESEGEDVGSDDDPVVSDP